jgi:hypothetical protein
MLQLRVTHQQPLSTTVLIAILSITRRLEYSPSLEELARLSTYLFLGSVALAKLGNTG